MTYSINVEQAEAIIHAWNCAGVTIRFEIVGTIFCLRRESQDDDTGTFYIGYPGKD